MSVCASTYRYNLHSKTVLRRENYSSLSFPLFKGVSHKMYKLAKEAIIQRKFNRMAEV